jgi:hypothetical protein
VLLIAATVYLANQLNLRRPIPDCGSAGIGPMGESHAKRGVGRGVSLPSRLDTRLRACGTVSDPFADSGTVGRDSEEVRVDAGKPSD